MNEFVPERPQLRIEPILRFQRYRSLDQVAPAILEVARDMVKLAETLIEPRVTFTTRAVEEIGAETVTLQDGVTFHGRCLARHLAGAREVVCVVATVGRRLDERIDALAEGYDLLEALFLDTAGWLAVEETLRGFRAHLRTEIRARGLRAAPRLGPGYLDWPLWEQADFFSLFRGIPMPVSLSEHCVMTPKKSVSGLFGLIPIAEEPRHG